MTQVLLVEDDSATLFVLRETLVDLGYQILEATTGQEALERLRTAEAPLLVLLDYRMPGMDGMSLLQVVAADPRLVATHAYVLMSASARELPELVEALHFPAPVDLLPKPFELEELWAILAQATRRLNVSGLSSSVDLARRDGLESE